MPVLAHSHSERAAAHLELLDARGAQALQQLAHQRVRVGPQLLRIGYDALQRRISSDALCPPKPIELDIEMSKAFFRATFGT